MLPCPPLHSVSILVILFFSSSISDIHLSLFLSLLPLSQKAITFPPPSLPLSPSVSFFLTMFLSFPIDDGDLKFKLSSHAIVSCNCVLDFAAHLGLIENVLFTSPHPELRRALLVVSASILFSHPPSLFSPLSPLPSLSFFPPPFSSWTLPGRCFSTLAPSPPSSSFSS